MKRQDLVLVGLLSVMFAPFFVFDSCYQAYLRVNAAHGFLLSAVKFGILATMGEVVALRIRTGSYRMQGFGLLPRAIVWAVLGVTIKAAFVVFGDGGPALLRAAGIDFAPSVMAGGLSGMKLLGALSISVTLNLMFSPVLMVTHKMTDLHIAAHQGSMRAFAHPLAVTRLLGAIDWKVMWGFVLKRTIPLFWIPAHTVTFLLPSHIQVLFAALLGLALGVLLAFGGRRSSAAVAEKAHA